MIQGSQEWLDARVGKVTASRVQACFSRPRKGSTVSKTRESYLADLLSERLTGKSVIQSFGLDDSEDGPASWGKKMEPLARAAYEARLFDRIELVGFVDHPTVPMSGASPDGLVGLGGVEIKCPNTATHLETVRMGKVPPGHIPQMKWNMACTGRSWWDFVSFDPRAEGEEIFFCRRLTATPMELQQMEAGVFAFVLELEGRLAAYHDEQEVRYGQEV